MIHIVAGLTLQVQEIEATEGLCETVTLTTAGNKAIRTPLITSLPLETPDVTKHKTLVK